MTFLSNMPNAAAEIFERDFLIHASLNTPWELTPQTCPSRTLTPPTVGHNEPEAYI